MEKTKEKSSLSGDDSEDDEEIRQQSAENSVHSIRLTITDSNEQHQSKDDADTGAVQTTQEQLKPMEEDVSTQSLDPNEMLSMPSDDGQQMNGDDLKQLETDKKAVYAHPLFPLLALLFEKCEIATRSIDSFDTDPNLTSSFNNEIEEFIQHQQRLGKPLLINDAEVDSLMIRSIQVFRIHLLELEKVSELCKDFCQRYTSCLRSKMRSDVLLRGTSTDKINNQKIVNNNESNLDDDDDNDEEEEENIDDIGDIGDIGNIEFKNSLFLSSATSMSSASTTSSMSSTLSQGSTIGSPPLSPSLSSSSARSPGPSLHTPTELVNISQSKSPLPTYLGFNFEQVIKPYLKLATPKCNFINDQLEEETEEDNMIAHDLSIKKPDNHQQQISNDLSVKQDACAKEEIPCQKQIKNGTENLKRPSNRNKRQSSSAGSGGGGGGSGGGGGHSKRGVLPKQATSIMRSWLFQHIVHPYPTEDEKRTIASQTNLTLLQVNNWFINARRRILQPMLDSANTIHHELVNTNEMQELDLSTKNQMSTTISSKKIKTSAQSLNRFWPQSLANIIQARDLSKS